MYCTHVTFREKKKSITLKACVFSTAGDNRVTYSDHSSVDDAALIFMVLSVNRKSRLSVPTCAATVAESEM